MRPEEKNLDTREPEKTQEDSKKGALSETWAEDAQNELQDFIEEQGIYIRQ